MSDLSDLRTPPLLSLCIPTYQRAALLGDALRSILAQWEEDLTEEQRRQVELIVSDNHSLDDTRAVVSGFKSLYPSLQLVFFQQPKNRGADANILQAAKLAAGDYVYLQSDDDILLPGALAEMLALIRTKPEIDAFCLNTRSFTLDPLEETPTDFGLKADRIISGCDPCLEFLGTRITFISALLFRRERLHLAVYDSYVGSSLLQSYLYLDVLAGNVSMYVTQRAFLTTRENNTGGYNFFEVFVTRFADLMRYARGRGYSEATIQALLSRHLRHFIAPFVATFKLHGSYGQLQPNYRDGARRLLAEYGPRPFLLFGLLPLMLAPRLLTRGLQVIVRALPRRPAAASGRVP